jgi:hypothetical protein
LSDIPELVLDKEDEEDDLASEQQPEEAEDPTLDEHRETTTSAGVSDLQEMAGDRDLDCDFETSGRFDFQLLDKNCGFVFLLMFLFSGFVINETFLLFSPTIKWQRLWHLSARLQQGSVGQRERESRLLVWKK